MIFEIDRMIYEGRIVQIEFKSLFQTPTINELEIVATNSANGSMHKLTEDQLRAVKRSG